MNFKQWTEKQGWETEETTESFTLPAAISSRYSNIPDAWTNFIKQYSAITNEEGSTWFLCQDDYEIEDEMMFSWDFIEKICQKTDSDEELAKSTAFWDDHFPIMFDIETPCRYRAIHLPTGNIVQGEEPNFFQTKKLAEDFDGFITGITSGAIKLSTD